MTALLLIDLQNDFMPGGALAVARGDEVVPVANTLQHRFSLVAATRDWHPPDHGSFAANHPGKLPGDRIDLDGVEQILWPVHCVQETSGAELVPGLDTSRIARVFSKGTDSRIDSYSGFFDNARRRTTGLEAFLRAEGVDAVYLLGLATDYCVKFSALDAVALGFSTYVVEDGCRGVELAGGDVERAIGELRAGGVEIVSSSSIRA